MMWWLQRYPDGMAEWSIVLWGRYPKTSMTWTHCLSLSKVRRGVYRGLFNLHRGYWRIWRYELRLNRQSAVPKGPSHD